MEKRVMVQTFWPDSEKKKRRQIRIAIEVKGHDPGQQKKKSPVILGRLKEFSLRCPSRKKNPPGLVKIFEKTKKNWVSVNCVICRKRLDLFFGRGRLTRHIGRKRRESSQTPRAGKTPLESAKLTWKRTTGGHDRQEPKDYKKMDC